MNKLQAKKIYLGIDYGTKRIGLAIGSTSDKIAKSFKIIYKINELNDIVQSKHIDAFVVGWPLQPDGTEGETCALVRKFIHRLGELYPLPVHLIDERMTSKQAEEFLRDGLFMRPEKRKNILDAESARIILQNFFDTYREDIKIK